MNPCEEYELLLSARLDGALSLKEETQLHAHLAQCPHCRQLAQELEDLQTQMTSLWVEPPDSLKDALASQDWSKSASSSPPRSPTASPSKRRHLLPWLACAAAAVVLVVGLCQLLLPGGADGLLPKAVIEVFQRPEQDPAAGSEDSDPAAPAVSRQEAQSLLTAYLAQQGRTLTLVPLDSSPNQGYWRFSGRDANGNAVTFLMVSCSTGQIHEIPVPPSSTGPGLG